MLEEKILSVLERGQARKFTRTTFILFALKYILYVIRL